MGRAPPPWPNGTKRFVGREADFGNGRLASDCKVGRLLAVSGPSAFRLCQCESRPLANAAAYDWKRPIADIGPHGHNSSMSYGRYAGMTVNERLFVAGRMEAFDTAVRARDHTEMVRILAEVEVEDAGRSADIILRNAAQYGY